MSTASLKAQLGTSTVIRAVPLQSHGVTSLSRQGCAAKAGAPSCPDR